MKAAAFCLSVLGLASPPIRQALAGDTGDGFFGAHGIVYAELGAGICAKIKLSQITVKVLFAAMLVGANHAALKDREKAFQRVRVNFALGLTGPNIFLVVIHALMDADKASVSIEARAVRMQNARGVDVSAQNVLDLDFRTVLDALRAHVATAFNERDNFHLVAKATFLGTLRFAVSLTDVGFVRFHDLAMAADGASIGAGRLHALADTVGHEPGGLVGDAQHAMQLMGGNAFFRGAEKVGGVQPFVDRDMAALVQGADADGELLAAIATMPPSSPQSALNGLGLGSPDLAAERANHPIRPTLAFQIGAGLIFVLENRVFEGAGGHGFSPMVEKLPESGCVVKYTIAAFMWYHDTVTRKCPEFRLFY